MPQPAALWLSPRSVLRQRLASFSGLNSETFSIFSTFFDAFSISILSTLGALTCCPITNSPITWIFILSLLWCLITLLLTFWWHKCIIMHFCHQSVSANNQLWLLECVYVDVWCSLTIQLRLFLPSLQSGLRWLNFQPSFHTSGKTGHL